MKRLFYLSTAIFLLLFATSCDEEITQTIQSKNVDLKYLPGSWAMESYETTALNSKGQNLTTNTRLDGTFVITIYEDMLFTLSGNGFLLAEGIGRVDVSRQEIGLNEYTFMPGTELEGADKILLPIVTSKTLHIEELDENNAELSLKYSDSITISAFLKRTTPASVTGKWIYNHGSENIPEGYKDLRIDCRNDSTVSWTSTKENSSGCYTYNTAGHLFSIMTADTETVFDVVCSAKSLRIASLSQPETKLYLIKDE